MWKKKKEPVESDWLAAIPDELEAKVVPAPLRRQEWSYPKIDEEHFYQSEVKGHQVAEGDGNCYVSRTDDPDLHLPCFDFDFKCEMYESRTPGHYHVYLNKPISWESYVKILYAMRDAGLVQDGWINSAFRQKHTTLRKPNVLHEFSRFFRRTKELELEA